MIPGESYGDMWTCGDDCGCSELFVWVPCRGTVWRGEWHSDFEQVIEPKEWLEYFAQCLKYGAVSRIPLTVERADMVSDI